MELGKPMSKLPGSLRKLLQEALDSIDQGNDTKLSALIPALIQHSLLSYQGADPMDNSLLNYALSNRMGACAVALVNAGASVESPDYRKVTPLMKAAKFDLEIVETLLVAGASIKARDTFGCTALHHAAGSHLAQPEIVSRLILAGGDANALDSAGRTPLHYAAGTVCQPKLQLLLESGADSTIKARGEIGTPLHYLQTVSRPDAIKSELEACVALLS